MKIARLKTLRINAPLGRGESYHDDGFVASIKDHAHELCSRYPSFKRNLESERYLARDYKNTAGCYLSLLTPRGREYHVFYVDMYDEAANIFTRAHEEAHVLHDIGKLDILAERLLTKQNVQIDFGRIDEVEVKVEIGGIYALKMNRLNPQSVRRKYKVKKYFDRAMTLYKQSRLPERRGFS